MFDVRFSMFGFFALFAFVGVFSNKGEMFGVSTFE
jgi:hypothetical protein